MKNLLFLIFPIFLFQSCSSNESIFILNPSQSMSITGKGKGQDAAFNPYSNGNSFAIIQNLGRNNFNIRVQSKGEIIENISIQPNEKKKITLLKGYELYLDSQLKSKAQVNFKKQD